MHVREDDLTGEAIARLLQQHLDEMYATSPPESVHALDLGALRAPDVTFWSAWEGETLVGCGALKRLDATTGEVKSMRTAEAHRGKGVASTLLDVIVAEARRRGYERLHLETGSMEAFAPARALYARHGFEPRGPFADYVEDPNSVFMTRRL